MKFRSRFIFSFQFVLLVVGNSYTQAPIDTIYNEYGVIVLFSNNTWELVKPKDFNGILNDRVHELMNENGNSFTYSWNNSNCFPNSQNNLSSLKDTIWLCLNQEGEDFSMPVEGVKTSGYGFRKGRYHNGLDLDLETGDPVKTVWGGVVRYAMYNTGGFGNLVIVRHYNGLETFYAHLSKLLVFPNQEVKSGDIIGLGGNTGHSFGSHLHFEMRFYDACINPEEVIDVKNKQLKKENLLLHKGLFRPGAVPSDTYHNRGNNSGSNVKKVSNSQTKYHRIRSGDTLSGIARKYGTSVSKICALNGIRPTTILKIGRSLRVR